MKKFRGVILLQLTLIALLSSLFSMPVYAKSEIELNSKLTGKLNTNDSDTYKVVIPTDGKIKFVGVPDSSMSIILYLYGDDDKTTLISNTDTWPSKGKTVDMEVALTSGTYYLNIKSYNGSGSYTLTNTFTNELKANDTEPNNSFLEASSAENNKTITGHLGFVDSNNATDKSDWYKLDILEDGKLKLVAVPESNLSIIMYLYGDDGTTIIINTDTWPSRGQTVSIEKALMPGTYYLNIYKYNGSGSYTLTNTFTNELKANDTEPNNSFLDASSTENNITITGHLGFTNPKDTTDKSDWYKFVVAEDGKLKFVAIPDPTLSIIMYLYGDDGVTLINNTDTWPNKGQTVSLEKSLMPGTYYLNIINYNGSGSYTLTNTFSSSVKHNKIILTIGKPNMIFNSETKEVDPGRGTTPIIINGRTMVPIRAIIEAMGGTVGWNDSERKISIVHGAININLWLDKKEALINNSTMLLDVEPVSINGRTMVPLRFVIENLNCEVKWDDSTKNVIIEF